MTKSITDEYNNEKETEIKLKAWVRFSVLALFSFIFAFITIHKNPNGHAQSISGNTTTNSALAVSSGFNYGFDFTDQEPDVVGQDVQAKQNDPQAVASALGVLSKFSGSLMDQSIYGFGASKDPEPTAGNYDLSSIAPRINMITNAGGIPVMTLVQSPGWMHTAGQGDPNNIPAFGQPPTPDHFQDFANLCAHIAQSYPQIKYFVVWSEMRGFYNNSTNSLDVASYTTMYNDVYNAIKAARPDALVGGPYATMTSYTVPQPGSDASTLHGSWGYINAKAQAALSYWLANKVGADFVTVDGQTEIASANNGLGDSSVTDPLNASQKYAAVDTWLKSQTKLPIWWMESHIQPTTGWTDQQAAAARIATLALMSSSGAASGLQWQPQEQTTWADQGLWTSTEVAGGGQPTTLAKELPGALPLLRQSLTIVPGQPQGVLVATSGTQLLAINTNNFPSTASVSQITINLTPGDVLVEATPSASGTTPNPTTTPSTPTISTTPETNSQSNNNSNNAASDKSSNSTVTSSTITLGPNSTDLKNIKRVIYKIDGKTIANETNAPFTYSFKTSKLSNGCHNVQTTTYMKDGSQNNVNKQLCVSLTSKKWYSASPTRIVAIIACFVVLALIIWKLISNKKIAARIHKLSFGHYFTKLDYKATNTNTIPSQPNGTGSTTIVPENKDQSLNDK